MSKTSDLHNDLSSLQLHLPGRNVVDFSDDKALMYLMRCQYPNWKDKGIITSIPVARVPRIFLHCDQIVEPYDKRYKNIETGEHGEIQVYQELLKSGRQSDSGFCIFPNVENKLFKSKDADDIEIDVVIVHPFKGVFVLSVKNTTTCNPKRISSSMQKHIDFIRSIFELNGTSSCMDDNSDSGETDLPIHGIVMSLKVDVDEGSRKGLTKWDYYKTSNEKEKRLVFQPEQMKNFQCVWQSVLSSIPSITNMTTLRHIDILVARLMALNSMEGALALIHYQFSSYKIQERHFDKLKDINDAINQQFPENPYSEDIHNASSEVLPNDSEHKNKKKAVILWTKEQLKIINILTKSISISTTTKKGCRIIVSGPRGSGKTMLLIFLAHFAKKIYHNHFRDGYVNGDIVICDGRMSGQSLVLFEKLLERFDGTGIDVKRFQDEKSVRSRSKLILFDETNIVDGNGKVSEKFNKDQHVIFFTARPFFEANNPSYTQLKLSNTLRTSVQIATFIEKFRCQDSFNQEIKMSVFHNFEGSEPNICCHQSNNQDDPEHKTFVKQCISSIIENCERAKGIEEIFVAPFIHPITLARILSGLQSKGIDYQYRNVVEVLSKFAPFDEEELKNTCNNNGNYSQTDSNFDSKLHESIYENYPKLIFATGNNIDGVEYSTVLLLLDRSLPNWWDEFVFDSIFIAITRATTQLCVIMNDNNEPPMVFTPVYLDDQLTSHYQESLGISYYTMHHNLQTNSVYDKEIEKIISYSYWSKEPVFIMGKCLLQSCFNSMDTDEIDEFGFKLSDDDANENWFCGPGDKRVVVLPKIDSLNMIRCFQKYRFSAIVFTCHSYVDLIELFKTQVRHVLSYIFSNNHLSYCPLYLLTSYLFPKRRLHSQSISDYFSEQAKNTYKQADQVISPPTDILETTGLVLHSSSWFKLKEQGTIFFKKGDIENALVFYKSSFFSLKKECNERVHEEEVKYLQFIFEKIACLCTNISKMLYDIGRKKDGDLCIKLIQQSIEYAGKSIEMNPCWKKGYHRIAVANDYFGNSVESAKARKEYNLKCSNTEEKKRKKIAILSYKMKKSPSWPLVKYKKNVFMIDNDSDKGHFTLLHSAIESKCYDGPVSFLISPGIYQCNTLLTNAYHVDVVGNWDAEICPYKEWILKKSPVTILKSNFITENSRLSLSRVNLFHPGKHIIYALDGSNIKILQCFFQSGEHASISCQGKYSFLYVEGCRFVDTYSSILASYHCSIHVWNSFFSRTQKVCIELREHVVATVLNCTFKDCRGEGIAITRCTANIISCSLENNAINKDNHGSIQLTLSEVEVSDTCIQHQSCYGIVLQCGSGTFKNLTIQHCQKAGILVQAPCTIYGCSISRCTAGIWLCEDLNGKVILQDSNIKNCKYEICKAPGAPFPIVNGEIWSSKKRRKHLFILERKQLYSDPVAKRLHFRVISNYNLIKKSFESWPNKYASLDPKKQAYCIYCTLPVMLYPTNHEFMLCLHCGAYFYCSMMCYEKDRERHKMECEWFKKCLRRYRNRIKWNDEFKPL